MYGIDFGTTYTVISYKKDDIIQFLYLDGSYLIETKIDDLENLKRLLLDSSFNYNYLATIFKKFFRKLIIQIETTLKDNSEYKNCVITVPVRFNDVARNIIKYAAISAGFNVVKLLNEPVAAAICALTSALEKKNNNGYYLVYDLGGGTFDATLLKLTDDIFHVIKLDGIENFGGIDIDNYIADLYNISLSEAKILKETKYIQNLDLILEKTYTIINELSKNYQIEYLILNGGSAYLKNIENYFADKFKIMKMPNLQILVSSGALIYGLEFLNKNQFLIDVTPFNLGIETLGDKMEVIIESNSVIPIVKTETFFPVNEKVVLKILQGDSFKASECYCLANLSLKSKESFQVKFIIDCDGILTVEVQEKILIISNFFYKD